MLQRAPLTIAIIVASAVGALPLVGAWSTGRPLAELFIFPPPLAIPTEFPRFSWSAVGLVVSACAGAAAWLVVVARSGGSPASTALDRRRDRRGGAPEATAVTPAERRRPTLVLWAAGLWTVGWWVFAWTRFEWFAFAQRYTFFPLWLGFVVTVNALAWRRHGTCLMQRAPRRWLALFIVSAGVWWAFEWLNRFVQNWHYLGVQTFGPIGYTIHASLCFSTVLPAVAAVREWLGSGRPWLLRFSHGPAWPALLLRRGSGFVLVLLASVELVLLGARPQEHYAAVWGAPLALAVGWIILLRAQALEPIAAGDGRPLVAWALAALICGGFWEMWNSASLAKWIYTVPYVDRWHVFEMPLLGYTGYLPFGLLCGLATTWVTSDFKSCRLESAGGGPGSSLRGGGSGIPSPRPRRW